MGNDGAVEQLQANIRGIVSRIVHIHKNLQGGISFWGKDLLSKEEVEENLSLLNSGKEFFETVAGYKTPGTFKNFRYDLNDIENSGKTIRVLNDLGHYRTLYTNSVRLLDGFRQLSKFYPKIMNGFRKWIQRGTKFC